MTPKKMVYIGGYFVLAASALGASISAGGLILPVGEARDYAEKVLTESRIYAENLQLKQQASQRDYALIEKSGIRTIKARLRLGGEIQAWQASACPHSILPHPSPRGCSRRPLRL